MVVALLALLALGAAHGRVLLQEPSSCDVAPGEVCGVGTARVNQVTNTVPCRQPIQPTEGDCPNSALNFLASVVSVSTNPANSCDITMPCCDSNVGATECVNVNVGCIAGVNLCAGGAVGSLLRGLLGPALTINLGDLPIVG